MAKLNVKVLDMQNGEVTKVAYEGAEYAKVATGFAQAQSGDLFLSQGQSGETFGAFYEIKIVENGDNYPIKFVDDKGRDTGYMRNAPHLDLFRKISVDKPTLEQRVEAVELAQKSLESDVAALKGEKKVEFTKGASVKIIGLSKYGADEIGKIGEVEDVTVADGYIPVRVGGRARVYKPEHLELAPESEETIEFEGATYRKVDREAREGDVVIFRETGGDWFTVGVKYEVKPGVMVNNGRHTVDVYKKSVNRTRKTVDVYEPIEYVPQEGDIVVVESLNKLASQGARVKVRDIGKVGEEGDEGASVQVLVPGGSAVSIYVDKTEIRKATPAEVEKYEQAVKDAEIAEKWAKIGRKPNEFKKGDVLSYKYGSEPICYYKVTRIDGNKVYFDCHEFGNAEEFTWKDSDSIQLVSAVESLFNA